MKSLSFDGELITAGFVAADTNTSITHVLGRTPMAAFVVSPDGRATRIYKGTVAWTSTTINLRSSVAGTAVTLLII